MDGRYGDDVAVSAKKNVEIALRDIGGGAIDRAAAPSAEEVGLYRESFEEMVDADGERPAAEKRALLAGWDEAVRYVQTVVDWEGLKKARPYAHTGRRNLPAWFYTESDDDLILGLLQQWIQSKVSGEISSAAPLIVGG